MLETKGLYKIYKPKKGVPVTALKNVNIRFPDTGMVFLLGKSGSGKSTLLNVLGGLDRYDKGEIIIKGVSSRDFKQKHFDSYRNTYVGFIFQEYNVLEDFTVGANIALALQLQGKKATDAEINEILNEVDLTGFGGRRPNELSGGQKQRVAIARALVKKPEIIMADEPTGALDSATGKQVLETLKKLSASRLVIVVSHDREFAEQYADRIIELADGAVIRDVERTGEPLPAVAEPLVFGEESIDVQAGYQLTEEDRLAINEWLAQNAYSVKLHRQKVSWDADFRPTDTEKIPHRDGANFRLIKSKLPLKNAFRIGGSSLKHKKFRLVVTIFLSCIAFGLFGLSDTFGAYDHVKTCTNSMLDTGISYTSIQKQQKIGEGMDTWWWEIYEGLTDGDLEAFEEKTGVHLKGVSRLGLDLNIEDQIGTIESELYANSFSGVAAVTESDLATMGYSLIAGRLPKGDQKEIAVSSYMAETFVKGKYRASQEEELGLLSSAEALLGKTIDLSGVDYTVVGIVDTKLDLERYQVLDESEENLTTSEQLVRYVLSREFYYSTSYSLAEVAMVSPETYNGLLSALPPVKIINNGSIWFGGETGGFGPSYIGKLADFNAGEILWLDGARSQLAKNEIIVSSQLLSQNGLLPEDPSADSEALIEAAKSVGVLNGYGWVTTEQADLNWSDIKIVGVIDMSEWGEGHQSMVVAADEVYATFAPGGQYAFAVGAMPAEKSDLRTMVAYCYNEDTGIRYPLMNSVTYELDTVNDVLKMMSKIFLYIGLGFALFAALMLANFIATSISYKKQEIGILRAIGSRSSDVFRIFFSESFIIAMINFVLSSIGVGVATGVVNWILRKNGILISVLTFGPRQILLLLAVSILVAALASYFPVRRIAAKRPIDAIRNR